MVTAGGLSPVKKFLEVWRSGFSRLTRWGTTEVVTTYSALALVALGLALRLAHLGDESLWYDELLQLDIAQGPLAWLPGRLWGHSGVPLDYLVLHAWIGLGRGDAWVRLPAVVWGTLALALFYRLARRWLGAGPGLLCLALLVIAPLHVRYSQEVRPYALVVVGVLLAVDGFWRLRAATSWRPALALQTGVLIFSLAHLFALASLVPMALLAGLDLLSACTLAGSGRNRGRAAWTLGLLVTATLVPLAILLALGWGNILFYTSAEFSRALAEPERFSVEASQKPNGGEGPQVDAAFIQQDVLASLAGTASPAGLWLLTGLAGLGLVYLLARRRYSLALFLAFWLVLPPLLIISFLVYRGTFFAIRYLIYLLPVYLVLVAAGLTAVWRWPSAGRVPWLGPLASAILAGLVLVSLGSSLDRLYREKDKEDWRLVADFIARNAHPGDAVIAVSAEPALNWYYPPAWTAPNYYDSLETIQEAVAGARRSWVVLSLFSSGSDGRMKAWLGEEQAVRFVLDPIIAVYYLGDRVPHDQLLDEIQAFALPVDHALYASLARENRHRPAVARQYYRLAIAAAPDEPTRATYQAALAALR